MPRRNVLMSVLLVGALAGLWSCASVMPPKCVTCDETLWSRYKYKVVDGRRYAFHAQHVPKTCRFCGGVLTALTPWGAAKRTPEGVDACGACDREAVRDLGVARKLVAQVRADLLGLGMKLPWGPIPVALRKPDNPAEQGHCSALRSGRTVRALAIRFAPGMPRTTFKAVAAHELTHAWAYLHGSPNGQDEALSEGAPTFVEFTYVQKDASPQARFLRERLLTDRHPAYGEGFRRLKKYADRHQVAGVLAVLKAGRQIPKGF